MELTPNLILACVGGWGGRLSEIQVKLEEKEQELLRKTGNVFPKLV